MPAVPKPERIISRAAIRECRKSFCELCGRPAHGEPHHVRPRSLGGSDIRENLIQLCFDDHRDAHDGKLSHTVLIPVIAKREGLGVEEVYKRIGWPVPDGVALPAEAPSGLSRLAGYTLDDIIQLYINLQAEEDETRWAKGAICVACLDGFKMKAAVVASMFGCSAAQVREMARTFRAFPEESMRIPSLSWYHHRAAAKADNPQEMIALAADREWSTRQLEEAVKAKKSPEAKRDTRKAKAEKVILLTSEVLKEGGEVAEWLRRKLQQILERERSALQADMPSAPLLRTMLIGPGMT